MLGGKHGQVYRQMYTIEIVVTRGEEPPHLVSREACPDRRLVDAEVTAKMRLKELQKGSAPLAMPDGYQIFNENGQLVLRSWARDDA